MPKRPGRVHVDVRRIVRGEARNALECLSHHGPVADDAVHEARKRLKKARAGLRLIRHALDRRAFRRENRAFRDAARPLSEVRDAKILVETFDDLTKSAAPDERRALGSVRAALDADRRKARRRVLGDERSLKPVLESLRSARKRLGESSGGRAGWSVLGPGLRGVYRAGRDAFAAVRSEPTDDRLHEWRKQVKHLWYVLQILEPISRSRIGTWARLAHELSDHLGDDHDLAVLSGSLKRKRTGFRPAAIEKFSQRIARRRAGLQARAMRLGGTVYEQTPRAFAKTLETRRARRGRRPRRGTARDGGAREDSPVHADPA